MRKQQAEAGDIVLLYGDESEALTHPYLARAWAKAGSDLRVPAPGQAKKVAMLGSLDHVSGRLIVHTSPTKRSSDFVAHLEQLDRLYGPRPGFLSRALETRIGVIEAAKDRLRKPPIDVVRRAEDSSTAAGQRAAMTRINTETRDGFWRVSATPEAAPGASGAVAMQPRLMWATEL